MPQKKNTNFFESPNFKPDQYKFHLFYKMLGKDALFLSDSETYCIGRGKVGLPIWIWTSDNPSSKTVKKIESLLKEYYLLEKNNRITCKKVLYDYLKKDFTGVKNYFEMGFLRCTKLNNKIELSHGFLDKPNYGDKVTLARYWYDNCQEMKAIETTTYTEALEEAESFIEDENFYVWRNPEGKIVSMARYTTVGNQAKISHVYTPDTERSHGYCKSLIYSITKNLLDEGYIPLLYTDFQYEASNKVYKKVGYKDEGILINFTVPKQEDDYEELEYL